jgi:hypothetical protein
MRFVMFAFALGCASPAAAPPPSSPTAPAPPAAAPVAAARPALGFFVATSPDGSARLGGLAGADARCQQLAAAAGAGERTWRAYLSTGPGDGKPGVDARDRIGAGPWFNAAGALIARTVDELHGELHHIDTRTALDAHGKRGERAPHDILTGSDGDGRVGYHAGAAATCGNWTSDTGTAWIGHDDRMDHRSSDSKWQRRWNGSWNAEHLTLGCSAKDLAGSGGAGGFYCFAADPRPADVALAAAPPPDPARYTFRRGLNLNHWLGSNLPPSVHPNAGYAASWFDAEDVGWIAAQGFDHVRIWVDGNLWQTARGLLDETKLAPFDAVLDWARANKLGVILAMHGLPGYREPEGKAGWPFADDAPRRDAAYLWGLIARRYAAVGGQLRFELLMSPAAPSPDTLRALHAVALDEIRRVDRARMVYLTPRKARLEHAADVLLSDPNTALALEFNEPEIFTYQFGDPKQLKVAFPSKIPRDLSPAQLLDPGWAKYKNTEWTEASLVKTIEGLAEAAGAVARRHEVYISRIGVMLGVDDASARTYLRTVRTALEAYDMGWAVYDYQTGGRVRADDATGGPTRVLEGLGLR